MMMAISRRERMKIKDHIDHRQGGIIISRIKEITTITTTTTTTMEMMAMHQHHHRRTFSRRNTKIERFTEDS